MKTTHLKQGLLSCGALLVSLFAWNAAPSQPPPCYSPAGGPLPCFDGLEEPWCFDFTPPTDLNAVCPPLVDVDGRGCTGSSICPAPEDCYGAEGPCFAALATWWPSGQDGLGAEPGIHLRWAFNLVPHNGEDGRDFPFHPNGLVFPRGGFEIQRRQAGTGSEGGPWESICSRIYPAADLATAESRIPAGLGDEHINYTLDLNCDSISDLERLIDLLKRALCEEKAYETFWWTEGSDKIYESDTFPPEEQFHDYHVDADLFFRENGRPPLTFVTRPMELLMMAAVDPVVARILGLYYVDQTAVSGVAYDYRIIAHHDDQGFRLCAQVNGVGSGTVRPVPPPAWVAASLSGSDRPVVNLSWENQLLAAIGSPENRLELRHGFQPLRYIILRDDEGDPLGFERLKRSVRICGAGRELLVPSIFIGTLPDPGAEEGEDPPPEIWKDPPYYRDSAVRVARRYTYRVRGVDIFGRYSPATTSDPVDVVHRSTMPAPILTEARIFQNGEADFKGIPGDIVLRVRWLWPLSFRESHPDPEEFRVFIGERGIDAEDMVELGAVDPEDPPPARVVEFDSGSRPCDDGIDNDGDELIDHPEDEDCASADDTSEGDPACSDGIDNDGDGLIDHLEDEGCESGDDTSEEPDGAELFETYIAIEDPEFGEPVSEVDPEGGRVAYFEVGVRAYDSEGVASDLLRRQKVAVRDFTAPSSPASPARPADPASEDGLRPPSPPDPEGLAGVALEWEAEENLTYVLYRTDERTLCRSMISNGIDVPSCAALPDAQLAAYANLHLELFTRATPAPLGPFAASAEDPDSIVGRFADRVPGLAASRFLYFLRATDPAGNTSHPSPFSEAIFVRDAFPPAKPVIARAVSLDPREMPRTIRVEWPPNPEDGSDGDLVFYRLYRTDTMERARSKRKMVSLGTIEPADRVGAHYSVLDTVPRPERAQYYRLEAVDSSGNVSALSEPAAARTPDTLPPPAPEWSDVPSWDCVGEARIIASWSVGGDATESRLLDRELPDGRFHALTGWLARDPEGHRVEPVADPERDHELRLEARDRAGNVSFTLRRLDGDPDCVEARPYVRADPNLDESMDISDAIYVLGVLFLGAGRGAGAEDAIVSPFSCEAAADVNGSGAVDISDPIYLLSFLFLGGPPPAQPFPLCGTRAGDLLPCAFSTCTPR